MRHRVLFLVVLALTFSFLFLGGSSIAQRAAEPCNDAVCGPGYKPLLQSNGSCMCIAIDCTNADNCPEPPKVPEDCPSIEGCNPPRIIEP
ncbi:MAG: hypothetical protein KA801_14620 [Syntrophorhabdaceae bacterium]|nr:hypothetical protein [Syntrophorhabdaceae bacterium]